MVEYSIPSQDNTAENTEPSKGEHLQQQCRNHYVSEGSRSAVFSPFVNTPLWYHDNQLWSFNGNRTICSQPDSITMDPGALLELVVGKP